MFLEIYLFSGIEWANVEGESESGEGGLLGLLGDGGGGDHGVGD